MASSTSPTILRFAVRAPWDGDAPQRRVDLNAQRALGRVLDRRAWWTFDDDDNNDALVAFLVRVNVEQALAVWKEARAIDWTYLSQRAVRAVSLPADEIDKRCVAIDSVFQEMVRVVESTWYFWVGVEDADDPNNEWDRQWYDENASESDEDEMHEDEQGDDDSGDEVALDNDGNVVPFDVALDEARQWLREQGHRSEDIDEDIDEDDDEPMEEAGDGQDETMDDEDGHANAFDESRHAQENPFGHIAWFVCLLVTRERLLELDPESATRAAVTQILRRGPTRFNAAVITRTRSFISAWLRADETPSSTAALDALLPTCVAPFTRRVLRLHLKAIQTLIQETTEDVATAVRVIVEHLGVAVDTELRAMPGPVALTWIRDASLSEDDTGTLYAQLAGLRRCVQDTRDDRTALLVDPELFGAVAGQTKYRGDDSTNAVRYDTPATQMRAIMASPAHALTPVAEVGPTASERVRWLPSEVQINGVSGHLKATFRSYINNLHPVKYAGLYTSIERIVTQLVPLFENVLSLLDTTADLRALKGVYDHCQYSLPRAPRLVPRGLFDAGKPRFPLNGTQIQVVIRVSEIQLTPQTPHFHGDDWRCEGTDADQIIATGVYFYSVQNVTTPQLTFRTLVGYPNYKPDDDVTLGLEYGLQSEDVLAQELGNVTALEGRSVVFPNLYQYKVRPFGLVDRAKQGTLGMLTVMLVAPMANLPVLSTAMVPPQQCDWIQQEREPLLRQLNLPEVVETLVREFSKDGLTLDEARTSRDERLAQQRARPVHEASHLRYHRSDPGGY